MANELLTLPYSQRDVQDILSELKIKVNQLTAGAWTDFLDSDLGYALLKTAVSLYDFNAFFTDQQLAESFLSLCKTRESAIRLAKMLNYVPSRAVPATVDVTISFPAFNDQVDIPADSLWSINGSTFICESPISIPSGQTSLDLTLKQGSRYTGTFVANGQSWYQVTVPQTLAEIQVTVDDVAFTSVDSFVGVPSRNVYRLYEDKGGLTLLFGANYNTAKPASGVSVIVKGIMTDGAAGNNEQRNLPVNPVSVIRDSQNNDISGAFRGVTLEAALGGQDVESIDSIRTYAPQFYSAHGRLVTAADWRSFVKRIPGVRDAQVIGGETIGRYGEVHITVVGINPYTVSPDLMQLVLDEVNKIRIVTIMPFVFPCIPVDVHMAMEIGLRSEFIDAAGPRAAAVSAATAKLGSFEIGDSYRGSQFEKYIIEETGVDWVNTTITVDSFGLLQAGVARIPLIGNPDFDKPMVLRSANNTVLFNGLQSQDGEFFYLNPDLPDQQLKLSYSPFAPGHDVLVDHKQLLLLKTISVTSQYV